MSEDKATYEPEILAQERERENKERAAYMDIRRIIMNSPITDPSKQAEMVVREIAAGNVANVKMEW
jgi:hypothetical protein